MNLLAALLLGACSSLQAQPAGLSNDEAVGVAENILKAIDANDYQAFVHDFSDEMKQAFPEEQFAQLRDLLQGASGNYVSTGSPQISNNQGYAVYSFPCKYTEESVVTTLTFKVGGDKVEGLFFDSQNLRKASGK